VVEEAGAVPELRGGDDRGHTEQLLQVSKSASGLGSESAGQQVSEPARRTSLGTLGRE
jgi:hypothetical protein